MNQEPNKGMSAEHKRLTVSRMRDLEKQVLSGDISYSRMIELINEIFNKPALQNNTEQNEYFLELVRNNLNSDFELKYHFANYYYTHGTIEGKLLKNVKLVCDEYASTKLAERDKRIAELEAKLSECGNLLSSTIDANKVGIEQAINKYTTLKQSADELAEALNNTVACFEVAEEEGLSERLESVEHKDRFPGSLHDLITRRLLYDVTDKCRAALTKYHQTNKEK